MNAYKNFNIWVVRQYGRLPLVGRFYRKMADNMEADFWKVWRRWMLVALVYNVAIWLFLSNAQRKLDAEINAGLEKLAQPLPRIHNPRPLVYACNVCGNPATYFEGNDNSFCDLHGTDPVKYTS